MKPAPPVNRTPNGRIYGNDRLVLTGTKDQLAKAIEMLKKAKE